jgi:WhiB family redox-sensing transcriptional regulator
MTPLEALSSLRPDWWEQAACGGGNTRTEWWFPDWSQFRGIGVDEEVERAVYSTGMGICAGCGVKVECREWARRNGEREGLWGGEILDKREWRD